MHKITCTTTHPLKPRTSPTVGFATTPDNTSLYTLTSSGLLSASWLKSGSPKTAFGSNGSVDIRSKFCTALLCHADAFGSGSLLTAGGFEVSSNDPSANPMQGVVKHFDINTGKNQATYQGGSGYVRCLGIPGYAMQGSVSTIPTDKSGSGKADEDGSLQLEKVDLRNNEKSDDDDLYANDHTFNPNPSNDEHEQRLASQHLKAKEAKAYTQSLSNKDTLRTFASGGDDSILRVYDVNKCKLSAALTPKVGAGVGAMTKIASCEGREYFVVSSHRAYHGAHSSSSVSGGVNDVGSGVVVMWDVRAKCEVGRIEGVHKSEVNSMTLSTDGTRLFTGGGPTDPTIKEHDLRTYKKIKTVATHNDRILDIALLTTERNTYVYSASKDGTVNVTNVRKSRVVKSTLLAELSDYSGWVTGLSLSPMCAGQVFAGGQKKKSKCEMLSFGSDGNLRNYDLSSVVRLNDDIDDDDGGGGGGGGYADVSGGVRGGGRMKSERKEDNYHKAAMEFWDNMPSTTQNSPSKTPSELQAEATANLVAANKQDIHGNKTGSIEWWVEKMKHTDADADEKSRPVVGDLVVLKGVNVDVDKASNGGVKKSLNEQKVDLCAALPDEAKEGVLNSTTKSIGILLSDDYSGTPFEVRSSGSGKDVSWYEEGWIEKAGNETIESARRSGVDVDMLRRGEFAAVKTSMVAEVKVEVESDSDSDSDDGAAAFYGDMRGHGGWGEEDEEEESEEKSNNIDDEEVRAAPPQPPVVDAKEAKEEEARQGAVDESMRIYREQQKKKKEERGGRFANRKKEGM